MIDPPPLLDGVGLSTEKILYPWMETSASRCLSRVSSHISSSPMMYVCEVLVMVMVVVMMGDFGGGYISIVCLWGSRWRWEAFPISRR